MAYQIDYAYTCHTGKVRTNNEDNFWCCGVRLPVHNQGVDGILAGHTQHWQLPVLAVFDGMGGESCGEMAASAAVEALGGFYEENKKTSLVQIQKNMIINIDKIYAITKNSILYEDGKEYEIGRVYKEDFKKKYEEYIYDN